MECTALLSVEDAFGSPSPQRADDTVERACMEGRRFVSDLASTTGFAPVVISSAAARSRLIAALEGRDVDAALEEAMACLRVGGDVHLLLAAAKALVRAGLAGLAVRLLNSTRVLRPMQEELRSLVEELARLPSGERPFGDLAGRYRANVTALLAGQSHLHGAVDPAPPQLDDCHLFSTPVGNTQVVRDHPTGRLDFIFPFADHHRRAETLALGPVREGAAILALGVPPAPLLKRLIALRTPSGFRPPIDIIEPDARVFAVWLHLADGADAFRDLRACAFVGPDAVRQYERYRAAHLWRQEPTLTLKNHRPNWRADQALGDVAGFHEHVHVAVKARQDRLRRRQGERYARCTVESWARRFHRAAAGGPPLRVLNLTTRYSTVTQHVMRDLAAAFRRRGCQADVVTEPHDFAGRIDTWALLADRPYDLVIVLNHLRSSLADQIHPNIPYVCWVQDYMPELWTEQAGQSVGALDLVIGRDRGILTMLHGYPPSQFIEAGNLTDPGTYGNEPVPEADLAPYRCDVSYISHASATPEQLIDGVAERSSPPFGPYLRRVLGLMRQRLQESGFVSLIDTFAFMHQAERESDGLSLTPTERRMNVHPLVLCIFDRLFRHEALQWVADWADARSRSFRLFGRGWEDHPTLGRFACGDIENGYAVRCACQASRINLQINGYSSLHQRLLDSLACGGFVLTRYNPNDFIRRPMLRLQRILRSRQVTHLTQLLQLAQQAPEVSDLLEELVSLRQPRIAPASDPARRRELELMHEVGDFPHALLGDEMLLDSFLTQRFLPHRLAGDIPGFERTTFADRLALHMLLDRYIDDRSARRGLAEAMRRDVLAHDTYDMLAGRMLDHFAGLSTCRPSSAIEILPARRSGEDP